MLSLHFIDVVCLVVVWGLRVQASGGTAAGVPALPRHVFARSLSMSPGRSASAGSTAGGPVSGGSGSGVNVTVSSDGGGGGGGGGLLSVNPVDSPIAAVLARALSFVQDASAADVHEGSVSGGASVCFFVHGQQQLMQHMRAAAHASQGVRRRLSPRTCCRALVVRVIRCAARLLTAACVSALYRLGVLVVASSVIDGLVPALAVPVVQRPGEPVSHFSSLFGGVGPHRRGLPFSDRVAGIVEELFGSPDDGPSPQPGASSDHAPHVVRFFALVNHATAPVLVNHVDPTCDVRAWSCSDAVGPQRGGAVRGTRCQNEPPCFVVQSPCRSSSLRVPHHRPRRHGVVRVRAAASAALEQRDAPASHGTDLSTRHCALRVH